MNGTEVNVVFVDQNENIWVGTNNGLNTIDSGLDQVMHFVNIDTDPNSISSNHVFSVYQDSNKNIWVGTEFGLNLFIKDDQSFRRFYNEPSNSKSLLHNTVMDIAEDRFGNLYFATLGGLSVLNQGMGSFDNYTHKLYSNSISNNFLNCLLSDNYGNIWIGSERGGISYFNTIQNKLSQFEHQLDNENSLSNNTINAIYQDDMYLWIGTAGGGLNRYNEKSGSYKHYKFNSNSTNSLSSDFVTSIFRDSNGQLWIGTWGGGINLLMNEGKQNEYFEHISEGTSNTNLVSNYISSIVQDAEGNIWIGTLRGINKYNLYTKQFDEIISASKGLSSITGVGCLLFDSKNRLWVGTQTGLYEMHFNNGFESVDKILKYESDIDDYKSISGDYIISLLEDSKGNIWFGTYGQGLNKVITENGSTFFKGYTTSDGLSNNIIFGIIEDKYGEIWLTTDYGLSKFNPDNNTFKNFYRHHGFLNNQYYWSSLFINDEGKIYAGGMNGLDAFYPEWIKKQDLISKVLITDIRLLNESVLPGRKYNGTVITNQNVSKTNEIFLSYKEKQVGFEFSSLNYHENDLIKYEYILEGFEKDWNSVSSNRRFASYTNLAPGTYYFKVRTVSSDGSFYSEPTTIKINISTPYWDTYWFRTLVLVFILGLVLGYIRIRTYTLKKQKIALERQVLERTEKINQQKEELSAQAEKLLISNSELESNQELIKGQNLKLENQNKEILSQRDKLIKLNNKIKMINKLRLSFFTNISHEFRTPLTLIIGPLEKLLNDTSISQEALNNLKLSKRNAERLLHLINQIMDFRKIEQGRMQLKVRKGSINEFCKNIFDAFKPLAEIKTINYTYENDIELSEVWYDAQKIENILYNLLSNAFKYTPENGRITLKIKSLSIKESKLKNDSELSDIKSVISISVVDTGKGISEENLPLVFKRFYRIESDEDFKIRGSGIGLALTEELIKTHHGSIFVESLPQKGSVFEIQFPCLKGFYSTAELIEDNEKIGLNIEQQVNLLKEEIVDTIEEQEYIEVDHLKKDDRPTLLLVEDNHDLRMFMANGLQKKYKVLEANNGARGIEYAKKYNPDLIISDIMMPEVDGIELCTYLKNNLSTSHIPIILLTAKSSAEHEIEGLETGADDYLTKPFNFEVLEARISNILETRKKLRLLYVNDEKATIDAYSSNSKDQEFLKYAISLVEDKMSDPNFGVQEFIKEMGISRSLLHKKLTSLINQSASEFINHGRLKKARELLRRHDMNVSEVAYAVGYNDPKYFTRLFSKTFGQSPKDFQSEMSP